MSPTTFFLSFIPILSFILLSVNFILAPHKPYKEKKTPFECGYHSFLAQNRTQFGVAFFVYGMLFLLFDLEIVLIFPFSTSSYANTIYGLIVMIVFTVIVTVGFVYELGKNALKIESKQDESYNKFPYHNLEPKNSHMSHGIESLLIQAAGEVEISAYVNEIKDNIDKVIDTCNSVVDSYNDSKDTTNIDINNIVDSKDTTNIDINNIVDSKDTTNTNTNNIVLDTYNIVKDTCSSIKNTCSSIKDTISAHIDIQDEPYNFYSIDVEDGPFTDDSSSSCSGEYPKYNLVNCIRNFVNKFFVSEDSTPISDDIIVRDIFANKPLPRRPLYIDNVILHFYIFMPVSVFYFLPCLTKLTSFIFKPLDYTCALFYSILKRYSLYVKSIKWKTLKLNFASSMEKIKAFNPAWVTRVYIEKLEDFIEKMFYVDEQDNLVFSDRARRTFKQLLLVTRVFTKLKNLVARARRAREVEAEIMIQQEIRQESRITDQVRIQLEAARINIDELQSRTAIVEAITPRTRTLTIRLIRERVTVLRDLMQRLTTLRLDMEQDPINYDLELQRIPLFYRDLHNGLLMTSEYLGHLRSTRVFDQQTLRQSAVVLNMSEEHIIIASQFCENWEGSVSEDSQDSQHPEDSQDS